MSDAINPTSGSGAADAVAAAASQAVTANGGTPAAAAAAAQASSSTKVSDMSALKNLPGGEEFYEKLMLGLATTICTNMKRNQEDLKQMMRKAREDAEA